MFSHQDLNEDENLSQEDETNPTIAGVAQTLAQLEGKVLDEKQYITYEMLCCTFLLQLVNETLDPTSSVHKQVGVSISMDDNSELIDNIKQQLLARGGMDQLLLFLTGPAGAGKTTAIKAAERFCFEFCSSCNIIWTDTSFFYTAYTGSAASAFGGRTIVKASGMFTTTVTEV
jgi:flagellar biosynthesis GTPase FlhF